MKQLLLQDAIILGDTLKACVPSQWLSSNGSCGCALGGALLATGADPVEVYRQTEEAENTKLPINEIPAIKDRWPWLTLDHVDRICRMYFGVYRGDTTIEQIAAYVKTVEPQPHTPQPEPADEPVAA